MALSPRTIQALGVLVLTMFGLTACIGVEDLAEEALERQLEAESGEDIEIDFDLDGDSGGIRIEGEDGEEITLEFDENGEGSFSIEGTENGEDFTAEFDADDDGSVTINAAGDDGSIGFFSGEGVPEGWVLPVPSGDEVTHNGFNSEEERSLSITVLRSQDPLEAVTDYIDTLLADGWQASGDIFGDDYFAAGEVRDGAGQSVVISADDAGIMVAHLYNLR